jgi:hypothetical protein
MGKVCKKDYSKIANVYNKLGNEAAMEYIQKNYGTKAPRGVLMRIKKSSGFKYDPINNKIISDISEDKIFMGIEEICNNTVSKEVSIIEKSCEYTLGSMTPELLYKDLMQEKLMELCKYIRLDRYLNSIIIDKTSLKTDGYQIIIN